jgi:signal transduction histidine kinase
MQVMVEDDGCGFEPALLAGGDRQTFGLRIMRERTEEIGSSLQVHSAPGCGTKITAQVPLRKEKRDRVDEGIVGR